MTTAPPARISLNCLTATCVLLAAGSAARAEKPSAEQLAFFESKIRPVLSARCYTCHSEAAKKSKGGLTLDRRESMLKGGDTGPALVPGKPATSLLLKAVKYEGLEMPPTGKLPADEVAALAKWIDIGAPWPEAAVKPKDNTDVGVLTAERLKHWAFQPVKKIDPPAGTEADRNRHPIDRFVLVALTVKGLKPAPRTNRRTLIRRASLDLIGLPPTPEEVEAFLKDDSPDAYQKVIDKLLAAVGEFQRVREQVSDDLAQAGGVARREHRNRWQFEAERDTGRFERCAPVAHDVSNQFRQVEARGR